MQTRPTVQSSSSDRRPQRSFTRRTALIPPDAAAILHLTRGEL